MSVAGILSTAAMSIGAQFFQSRAQQMKQDFQQLGSDLQSGNLTAAQADFAALQKLQPKLQPKPPTTPSNVPPSSSQTGSTVTQDWTQLATDLKAGNLSAAQQTYSTMLQDFTQFATTNTSTTSSISMSA